MSAPGAPQGATLTPSSQPEGGIGAGPIQPNPSAAGVVGTPGASAAAPSSVMTVPLASTATVAATVGAMQPIATAATNFARQGVAGQGVGATVSMVQGTATGLSVNPVPVVPIAEVPIGSMSDAQLEAELGQFIEDSDPALATERKALQDAAAVLQPALVFKVDGCVITKAEKEFSSTLQVKYDPQTIFLLRFFLTIFSSVRMSRSAG